MTSPSANTLTAPNQSPAVAVPAHLTRLVLTGLMGARNSPAGPRPSPQHVQTHPPPGRRPPERPPNPPPPRAAPSHSHHLPRRPLPRPLGPLHAPGSRHHGPRPAFPPAPSRGPPPLRPPPPPL